MLCFELQYTKSKFIQTCVGQFILIWSVLELVLGSDNDVDNNAHVVFNPPLPQQGWKKYSTFWDWRRKSKDFCKYLTANMFTLLW